MKPRINIAGGFAKKHLLIPWFFKNKSMHDTVDVTVYDGIQLCPWNGGRINRDLQYDDKTIDFYYRNNISIAMTFTNPVIDLNDSIGLHLLEKFHHSGNYIISVNMDLYKYIKDNFPKYKHTRSITGFGKLPVPMNKKTVKTYKDLEKYYDYIVPRMEHVFDPMFKELNQNKYEVMVNDTCVYGCPYFDDHFKQIAHQNCKYTNPWKDGNKEELTDVEECWLPNFDPDVGHIPTMEKLGEDYGMDLTTKQMKRLAGRGIRSFKVTGREMTDDDFQHEMNIYLDVYKQYIK